MQLEEDGPVSIHSSLFFLEMSNALVFCFTNKMPSAEENLNLGIIELVIESISDSFKRNTPAYLK